MHAFSIIELLVSVALITSAITGAILVTSHTPASLLHSSRHLEAITHAQAGISGIFARKSQAFSTEKVPELETHAKINLTNKDFYPSGIKLISNTSLWKTIREEEQAVSLHATISDYQNASSYLCSPFLSNIHNRTKLVPVAHLPNISSLAGNYAVLLATSATTTPAAPSVFLYSHKDREVALATTHTRTGTTTVGYIGSTMNTTHAFLISNEACSTRTACASLDVFELTNMRLSQVSSQKIPTPRSIVLSGTYLYIGLRAQPQGPELLIFDVSIPENPHLVGDAEIGSSVNSIAIDRNRIYIATADNSTAGNKSLMTFDGDVKKQGMIPESQATQPGAGMSQKIYLLGSALALGRTALHNSKELYFFDSSNLKDPLHATDTDTNIVDLLMRGVTTLVLTKKDLQQWNAYDYPKRYEQSKPMALPTGVEGVALICAGRNIFVAGNLGSSGTIFSLP